MTRLIQALVLTVALTATLGFATGALAKGGNSANAKKCQQGGWQTAQTNEGTSFSSEDDCISYGAHGGVVFKPSLVAVPDTVGEEEDSVLTASGFHPSTTAEVHIQVIGGQGGSITLPATTDASGSRQFFDTFPATACDDGVTAAEITFTDSFGVHASTTVHLTCP
jgi:hypothetical protein